MSSSNARRMRRQRLKRMTKTGQADTNVIEAFSRTDAVEIARQMRGMGATLEEFRAAVMDSIDRRFEGENTSALMELKANTKLLLESVWRETKEESEHDQNNQT